MYCRLRTLSVLRFDVESEAIASIEVSCLAENVYSVCTQCSLIYSTLWIIVYLLSQP